MFLMNNLLLLLQNIFPMIHNVIITCIEAICNSYAYMILQYILQEIGKNKIYYIWKGLFLQMI